MAKVGGKAQDAGSPAKQVDAPMNERAEAHAVSGENRPELDPEIVAKIAEMRTHVREAFGKGCFLRDCAGNLIEFVEA